MTEDGGVITFGPVTQKKFLLDMGIEQRVAVLKKNADEKQKESIDYGFHMMTDDDQMGSRFKFLAVVPAVLQEFLKKFTPAGFME